MKKVSRHLVFCGAAGLILAGLLVGHEAQGQMQATWCPGQSQPWSFSFVGTNYGTINAGDTVVGTVSESGLVFQTCQVNAPTTGTCTVAPDFLSISFNLVVQSPVTGDISGTVEVPTGAPSCGLVSATLTLTEPHSFQGTQTSSYACNGLPCPSAVPAVSGPGLAVMGLLLAGTAVLVLKRS
jgi:hypothetical protein